MWVGQQLADGLDFWGFLGSLILGGIILGIYTGLLGSVGAKPGRLQGVKPPAGIFGRRGGGMFLLCILLFAQ